MNISNISQEQQDAIKDLIKKHRKKEFMAGRQSTLKALRASFVLMDDEFFTRENIFMLLDDLIEFKDL